VKIDFKTIMFWALALATVLPAFMVIIARDIVRVAFWLLASLSGVAGLFIMLDADFLGITQVLVYIGGILVLILFGIMMTNKDPVMLQVDDKNRRPALGGIIIALSVFAGLLGVIMSTGWQQGLGRKGEATTRDLGVALLTDYVLPFEIISVLLLVVLCGAAYIARRGGEEVADA
jgi:NADH-quinone oxidoreductase subunit J